MPCNNGGGHYKYFSLPSGPIRDLISRGCWRGPEKEELPPPGLLAHPTGAPAVGGALASSFGDQHQGAPTASPSSAPWGGFTTAWPQVGAHNGFPLHTLHQGFHREGCQLGELALDGLSESKIQQRPEASVLPSSTPAGGFLETPPT